ncbi:MAG: hypothetical protein EBU08_11950, partial [Micrococcales bacterium]|nr:hypothetical protein [Micrococcales bacterium]
GFSLDKLGITKYRHENPPRHSSKGKYPKCRPLKKVSSKTPATVGSMTDKEKKSAVIQKRRVEPKSGSRRGKGNAPRMVSHHDLKKKDK